MTPLGAPGFPRALLQRIIVPLRLINSLLRTSSPSDLALPPLPPSAPPPACSCKSLSDVEGDPRRRLQARWE
eukprot:43517-Pyramimonas_sp.AAC.1